MSKTKPTPLFTIRCQIPKTQRPLLKLLQHTGVALLQLRLVPSRCDAICQSSVSLRLKQDDSIAPDEEMHLSTRVQAHLMVDTIVPLLRSSHYQFESFVLQGQSQGRGRFDQDGPDAHSKVTKTASARHPLEGRKEPRFHNARKTTASKTPSLNVWTRKW
jgi:hypothetical protein